MLSSFDADLQNWTEALVSQADANWCESDRDVIPAAQIHSCVTELTPLHDRDIDCRSFPLTPHFLYIANMTED